MYIYMATQSLEEIGGQEKIRVKSLVILFVLFIIISTDLFAKHVLSYVPNTVTSSGGLSLKGVATQGIILVLLFVVADLLVMHGVL